MKPHIKVYTTVFCALLFLQGKLYVCLCFYSNILYTLDQIILFLTWKFIQGDGVFEQSKGEPEAVSEEMELREIGQ